MIPGGGYQNWAWINPANKKPLVPNYAMLACNPDTELHWLWRRFHPDSQEWKDKYEKRGRHYMVTEFTTRNEESGAVLTRGQFTQMIFPD